MTWDLQGWPASARTAALSILIVAIAYVIGRVARYIVANQLGATRGEQETVGSI